MFRFSLQTALDVRSRQEKIKMKELAEKLAAERSIQNRIVQIKENTRKAELDLNTNKQERHFTIDQMKFFSRFKGRMTVVLADCFGQLETAKKEVSEQQQNLIEASRAKKTLEILKEKEQKKYLAKISTLERKNLDEIAGNMFVHKQRTLHI